MRRRRWIRRIGALVGTVALGGLLGFLVPTVVAEYMPAPAGPSGGGGAQSVQAGFGSTELPIAREFINAFVTNDQVRLKALGADEVDTVKANDLAGQGLKIGKPVLLGSISGTGVSIQAYAAEVTLPNGSTTILSWRVLTNSGRATLILPPDPLGNAP
jgi:hypothetical protein